MPSEHRLDAVQALKVGSDFSHCILVGTVGQVMQLFDQLLAP